jgi:uncharacterized membrane protein
MSLTYSPFAETPAVAEIAEDLRMNLPDSERIASGIFGVALAGAALSRVGPARWLLLIAGAALFRRGFTGRCPAYSQIGLDRRHASSGVPGDRGTKLEHDLEIHRSPEVLYAFWRDLENLPKVMRHIESIQSRSARRSRWQVTGPLGQPVSWEAEIISEERSEHIAWQSLPGSTISNAGSVWFEPTAAGGTRLRVTIQFDPPAGALGASVAAFLGSSPQQQLVDDLARFKEYAERELAPFAAATA